MNIYKVRCVDRDTAKPYEVKVQAEDAVSASQLASENHILAANHAPEMIPETMEAANAELRKMSATLQSIESIVRGDRSKWFSESHKELARTIRWSVFRAMVLYSAVAFVIYLFIWTMISAASRPV